MQKAKRLPFKAPSFLERNAIKAGKFLYREGKIIAKNTVEREIRRAKKSKVRGHNQFGLYINNPSRMTDF